MASPRQFTVNEVDGYTYKQSSPRSAAAAPATPATTTASAGPALRRSTITFYSGLHKADLALEQGKDEDLGERATVGGVRP